MEMSKIKEHNQYIFKTRSAMTNHHYLKKTLELINKHINKNESNLMLDVGCLDGKFLLQAKQKYNVKMFGVDIVKEAISKAIKVGISATVIDINEQPLPFKENMFDIITCCDVLEHIIDTDFAISEMKRVLRQRGTLILSMPNSASLHARFKLMFRGLPSSVDYRCGEGSNGHIRAYCPKRIKAQLESQGFKVLSITSPNLFYPSFRRKIHPLTEKIILKLAPLSFGLGGQIIVTAKKKEVKE